MADRDDGTRATPIELAPQSVVAGFTRAARWLGRLPRRWFRGWLSLAYALGTEPHYLAGPSSWLVRNELARRAALDRDRRGDGDDDRGSPANGATSPPPARAVADADGPAGGVAGQRPIDATFASVR